MEVCREYQLEEGKCAICGKTDVPLLEAYHKELGLVMICRECWERHWNEIVSSGSGERGCSCG